MEESHYCLLCHWPVLWLHQHSDLDMWLVRCPKCKTYRISAMVIELLKTGPAMERASLVAAASRRKAASGDLLQIDSAEGYYHIAWEEENRQRGGELPPSDC